jgi:hypothetical protein
MASITRFDPETVAVLAAAFDEAWSWLQVNVPDPPMRAPCEKSWPAHLRDGKAGHQGPEGACR